MPALRLALFLGMAAMVSAAPPAPRNLFAELLGKSETEINEKLDATWRQFSQGNEETERLYYPVGEAMAYIADTGNEDVRSEGMSYGMMLAVQLNRRGEFDRLWKWAKVHLYHADGRRRGYLAWHGKFDGTVIDPGSASDGEEWFAMALLFASHRWGDGEGIFNYGSEAQSLLREMRLKPASAEVTAIFNRERHQVVFAPTTRASTFTDPSYHLPAFYQLWARWDQNAEGRAFWAACATESRAFFRRAAHPRTGLMPEYANFDGTPLGDNSRFGGAKGDFRFDAWRTLSNVALDHAWFAADPWQVDQSNRVLHFLASQGPNCANQFTLDGRPLSEESSLGLTAMAAVAGLAADPDLARPFVQQLWDAPVPTGKWRYYDGLLYLLGLLEASGRFQPYSPSGTP